MERVLVAVGTWFAANGVIVALFVQRARRLGRLGRPGRSRAGWPQPTGHLEAGAAPARDEDSPRPVG